MSSMCAKQMSAIHRGSNPEEEDEDEDEEGLRPRSSIQFVCFKDVQMFSSSRFKTHVVGLFTP